MRVLVCSLVDAASVNIRDRLLELGHFSVDGDFKDNPVYWTEGTVMVTISERHLFTDDLDITISDQLGIKVDDVVFLSKHRAASGIATLTVHPIGNYGKAEFGGRDSTLVQTSPHLMTTLLRGLKRNVGQLPLQVSFEVTHHGPILSAPTLFIEIGSDENNWGNVAAAEVLARSLLEVDVQEFEPVIGIGGGHYAPRFTELSLAKKVSFGHMVPNYALEHMDDLKMIEILSCAAERSRTKKVYVHKKSMNRPKAAHIRELVEKAGLTCLESDDLETLC